MVIESILNILDNREFAGHTLEDLEGITSVFP